jgi:RND superfamily putative drug exporter
MTIIPTTSPQDSKTTDLVHHLRDDVIPPAIDGTGMHTYLGGGTAAFADVSDKIIERMPIFFVIVIGLSIILLAAVFRSVVVPLKAAIMNLLSIGSTFGVLIAVFQWGWLGSFFGVAKEGPIESFLPMMLFAILFGLSMDYEVFLLSRIREDYVHRGDSREAVANGLSTTARVIAAAAAIMVCVFGSFILGDDRIIKEFGLGLGTAIFVDATIVRLILVPATMELLGDWNWWFPRWLDRLLPKLNVEGEMEPLPAKAD